jgi:hypothetical protein
VKIVYLTRGMFVIRHYEKSKSKHTQCGIDYSKSNTDGYSTVERPALTDYPIVCDDCSWQYIRTYTDN